MPNNDYILRSDALKAIRYENWREENRVPSIEELHLTEYQLLAEAINKIPAADVEPVRHRRWIPGDYVAVEHGECVTYPGEGITCSWCHYGFKRRFLWSRDYCPHCGAKMDAEPPKEEDNG